MGLLGTYYLLAIVVKNSQGGGVIYNNKTHDRLNIYGTLLGLFMEFLVTKCIYAPVASVIE